MLELKLFTRQEKPVIASLLNAYLKELGERTEEEVSLHYPYLDHYWKEEGRWTFKILDDREVIGFALVNQYVLSNSFGANQAIAEFYILPEHRGVGNGKKAAFWLFNHFSGKWEVAQMQSHTQAICFWRKVIGEFTAGCFQEKLIDGKYVQLFEAKGFLNDKYLHNDC